MLEQALGLGVARQRAPLLELWGSRAWLRCRSMTDPDPLRSDLASAGPVPPLYALSTVVYAERGEEILLLHGAAPCSRRAR